MKLSAFYIGENLDLARLRADYAGEIILENPSELFYRLDAVTYFYAFDFGVVVFGNMTDTDVSTNLILLQNYVKVAALEKLRDDFDIEIDAKSEFKFTFDSLFVPRIDDRVLQITMMNLAQSVALDHYNSVAEQLLADVQTDAEYLEKTGKLRLSRRNMLKNIGKTLNSKNKIASNLYIFDSPDMTWDDPYLDQIHRGLVRAFDLPSRFREVEHTTKIVDENLSVFLEVSQHRESATLEWIIIVLICIEVGNLILSKL
jgi:required for meiotic nuclear division protein 1